MFPGGIGDHSLGTVFRNSVQMEYLEMLIRGKYHKQWKEYNKAHCQGNPNRRQVIQNEASSKWGLKEK